MIKISILIPAYNVEKWLPRCLDSILNQENEEVEVVIVNDGSTDATWTIAKDYAEKWSNIRVFTKKNEGVGAARNFLLEKAEGSYIWFVDSDDYVVEGCLQTIIAELNDSIDMLGIGYNDTIFPQFEGSGIEYIEANYINGYLWTKIIQKNIIDSAGVRFDPDRYSQEDWLFLMQIYPLLKVVRQVPLRAYVYCDDNQNSVMRGGHIENTKRNVADSRQTICNFKGFVEHIKDQSYAGSYERWLNFSAAGYLYSLLPIDYPITEIKNDLKIFRDNGIYPVGRTGRKKANLFLKLANREALYMLLVRLYRLVRNK